MKKTFWIFLVPIILVFNINCFSSAKKHNIFGVEIGQNKTLDKIHQKITSGGAINTITVKMVSAFTAPQSGSRKVVSKVLMKDNNFILLQARVACLDHSQPKGSIAVNYLCDGKYHWSDENGGKRMAKLNLESKYYTELYYLENVINHRLARLKALDETPDEYQVITEYRGELITYHVSRPGLLINEIDFESWSSDHNHLEEHIKYSKYIKTKGIYTPKTIKVERFRNGAWYETGEIEVEEIRFNRPISQEITKQVRKLKFH